MTFTEYFISIPAHGQNDRTNDRMTDKLHWSHNLQLAEIIKSKSWAWKSIIREHWTLWLLHVQ